MDNSTCRTIIGTNDALSSTNNILLNVSKQLNSLIQLNTQSNEQLNTLIENQYKQPPEQKLDSGIKTLTTAVLTDPGLYNIITTTNLSGYTQESIKILLGRNSSKLYVSNLGPGIIYLRVSKDGASFSNAEAVIYEGEIKTFYNVYEIRLRSPTANTNYIYTEYEYDKNQSTISRAEKVEVLSTNKDTNFIGAINQWAQEKANITGLTSNRYMIRGVNIQSTQPLKFQLLFWSSATFDNTDKNLDTFLDSVELDMSSSPTFQIDAINQYYLNISGLEIVYEDIDETQTLHISLQNLDPVAKLAGIPGNVQIDIKMTPRL